jgi:hypothetical protein
MRGLLLSEINDKKILEKIVGKQLYNRKGENIGIIWKIYISKKDKHPLKVVIKTHGNQKITTSPERIRIEKGKIYLLDQTHEAARAIIDRLSEIVAELRNLRDTLLLLDEKYISSEITPEEYQSKRGNIERKRLQLRIEATTLLETLNHLIKQDNFLDKEEETKIYEIIDALTLTFPTIHLKELEKIFTNKTQATQIET